MRCIPDYIQKELSILFVGYNPSLRSGLVGHHYANPRNRFWLILYQSGLTPRLYKSEEDYKLLELGYGLTNIVERPTKTAAEITKEEYERGKQILRKKIEKYMPRIVCFVGKGVYVQYSSLSDVPWGTQPHPIVPGVIDFVAPSSSGLVRMKLDEIIEIYKQLKILKDSIS
jgi:double-stranded uracil-DNA glycosylase